MSEERHRTVDQGDFPPLPPAITNLDPPYQERGIAMWRAVNGLYDTIQRWRAWHIQKTTQGPRPLGWHASWPPSSSHHPAGLEAVGNRCVRELFKLAAPIASFCDKSERELIAKLPAEPKGDIEAQKEDRFLAELPNRLDELEPLREDCWHLIEHLEHNPLAALLATQSTSTLKSQRKRKRRRQSVKKIVPITARQLEAAQLVGEHKGNVAAAAAAVGISRTAMKKRYDKAMGKLGKKAMDMVKTQSLPTDSRGQIDVPDPQGPKSPARPRCDKKSDRDDRDK